MRPFSFHQAFVLGLLAAGPLAAGFTVDVPETGLNKRFVGSLISRAAEMVRREPHHTEAQIAAKEAAAAGKPKKNNHPRQAADEFGPWDSTEDEFGSWLDKREPEPHHTEAQIAAKEAAGKGKNHHKRHHTEAQIAAKEAAAAGKPKKNNHPRQAADEFGPWDSTEDEFGSWLDKREPEPHHTEAQIAAKEAAGKGKNHHKRHHTEAQIAAKEAAKNKHHNRSPQEADEFGPWDSTEDEFGSWLDKREPEPHHTEAQIAAKEAAGKGKNHHKRHHTEAQIAAKEAAKGGKPKKGGN